MVAKIAFSLFTTILLMNHAFNSCSALAIQITPEVYIEEDFSSVNVTCVMDGLDDDAESVHLMNILRDGEDPIVYMNNAGKGYDKNYMDHTKYRADGHIDKDSGNPFLTLTIIEPNTTDAGEYVCRMYYSDKEGYLKDSSSRGNLTVVKLDLRDLVKRLLNKVSSLEGDLDIQTYKAEKCANKTRTLEDTTKKLGTKNEKQDKELTGLRTDAKECADKTKKQEEEIRNLKTETGLQRKQISARTKYVDKKFTQVNTVTDLHREIITGLNDTVDKRFAQVKTVTDGHQEMIVGLNDTVDKRFSQVKTVTDRHQEMIGGLSDKVNERFAQVKTVTDGHQEMIVGLNDTVSYKSAFSAYLTSSSIFVAPDTTVVFDTIIMKEGDGYDESTGIFTAPRDGMYVFHLDMTSRTENITACCKATVYLVANNANVAKLTIWEAAYPVDDQSSVSSVVELKKGAEVKARADEYTMRWQKDMTCVFTGYLIKAY